MIFWRKYRLELRRSMNGRSDDQISPMANRCARSAKAEEHELLVRQVLECCSHSKDRFGDPTTGWLMAESSQITYQSGDT